MGWPSGWRQKADERIFIRAVRSVAAAKMALLVPKGTQFFPDSQVSFIFSLLRQSFLLPRTRLRCSLFISSQKLVNFLVFDNC